MILADSVFQEMANANFSGGDTQGAAKLGLQLFAHIENNPIVNK